MELVRFRHDIMTTGRPGELAYADPSTIPDILEDLPDGSILYGTVHRPDPIRIDIPITRKKKKGRIVICPSTVWPGVDPAQAMEQMIETFGWYSPTPGGCARRLVRECLRGTPLYGANGSTSNVELIRELSTVYFPGPISRQLQPRITGDACVIDQRAAYLAAMGRPLPYGRPYPWQGTIEWDGSWSGDGVIPDALCGVVETIVSDPRRWHGCRLPDGLGHAYPSEYVYRGTWFELRRGVETGRLILPGRAQIRGWIWSCRSSDDLREALTPMLESDRGTDEGQARRKIAKLLYTRGWVQHVYPGYRRGIVTRDPTQLPPGYIPDQVRPWIGWATSSIDPEVEPRIKNVLQRPERSAHVVAYLRDELLTLASRVISSGGQVGQLLVDAAVVSREALPHDLDIGTGIGQWRIEDADDMEGLPAIGEYQAHAPGRYQIRDTRTGSILRNRHSGTEVALGWDEMGAIIPA